MGALAQKNMSSAWGELGNVEGDVSVPSNGSPAIFPNDPNEYPAIAVDNWRAPPIFYGESVEIGMEELVAHLNDRYAGNGPGNQGACHNETLILGGYSQGADVVGWALRRHDLSQAAKDHIGYVALYGDPKFEPGSLYNRFFHANFDRDWWWVRGDDWGYRPWAAAMYVPVFTPFVPVPTIVPDSGILSPRTPYVPSEFKGRFGSWCALFDAICAGWFPFGQDVHSNAYQGGGGWIAQSVGEVVWAAGNKHNQLNPNNQVYVGSFTPPNAQTGPPAATTPPPPVITDVKRTTDHTGVRQVYAATNTAVTEAWWHPGQGVQKKEIIHIAQGNIVGFDKVNEPDGTTQSLYTAVPDGVWETWWRPNEGIHHNKIITGLSGVRQVIADPVVENGQYTHRLYILAQDGPYEAWWRDGGDGIHISRLDIVNDPVTMDKAKGPDGTEQLYVATPTYVYELWWRPGESVHHGEIIHISQGDIRGLDKGDNLSDGGQLLYTGTSTTAWQSYWLGSAPSHGTIAQGQTNAIQIEKDVYNGVHELYLATGDHVQEYWWNGPNSGTSELIRISQNNITAFDKSNDGADQQVYTASGDLVYETWWRAGVSPTSSVLFKVAR
ncbi:cutinase family protein [Candidatus Protofrankia californiensis]|uniref:cutinase family protein n=1 Tax=Candidatus Protofrankia californiensis TaxID=1839754 RepID=UPI0013E9E091|nr:cutinase family protein [Candidatus Protofrankia californiensis]